MSEITLFLVDMVVGNKNLVVSFVSTNWGHERSLLSRSVLFDRNGDNFGCFCAM